MLKVVIITLAVLYSHYMYSYCKLFLQAAYDSNPLAHVSFRANGLFTIYAVTVQLVQNQQAYL